MTAIVTLSLYIVRQFAISVGSHAARPRRFGLDVRLYRVAAPLHQPAGRHLRHRQPDRGTTASLRGHADPAVCRPAGRYSVLLAPDPFVRVDRRPRLRRLGVGVPGGADLLRPDVRRDRHGPGQPGLLGHAGSGRGDGELLPAQRRRTIGAERRPTLAAPVGSCAGTAGRRDHPRPWRRVAQQAAHGAGRYRAAPGRRRPAAHPDRSGACHPWCRKLAARERPNDPPGSASRAAAVGSTYRPI